MLQKLTFNISGATVRFDTLDGREQMVVPVVMMTEGVHPGSEGPLFYPGAQLKKAPGVWNHKPIVDLHPASTGGAVSACTPTVINNQRIGIILNCHVPKTGTPRWKAEAWFDVEKLRALNEDVYNSLQAGEKVEVSTGLGVNKDNTPGVWNGKEYDATATEYQPDHLAVLHNQVGACSISDGAGLLQNAQQTNNELSHDETRSTIRDAVRVIEGLTAATDGDFWLEDVYNKFVVYHTGGKLYKRDYVVRSTDSIDISSDRVAVRRVAEYLEVNDGTFTSNYQEINEGAQMKKSQIVNEIVANAKSGYEAADKGVLNSMGGALLVRIFNTLEADDSGSGDEDEDINTEAGKPATKPAENSTDDTPPVIKPEPKTEPKAKDDETPAPNAENTISVDAYIAAAPAGLQDVLRSSVATHNQYKETLIQAIVANENNQFTQEWLMTQNVDTLTGMASLATVEVPQTENTQHPRILNFQGNAGGSTNVTNSDESLVMPTMSFAKAD